MCVCERERESVCVCVSVCVRVCERERVRACANAMLSAHLPSLLNFFLLLRQHLQSFLRGQCAGAVVRSVCHCRKRR